MYLYVKSTITCFCFEQLLDKINTDTEMDDIVQDFNAVSLNNCTFIRITLKFKRLVSFLMSFL